MKCIYLHLKNAKKQHRKLICGAVCILLLILFLQCRLKRLCVLFFLLRKAVFFQSADMLHTLQVWQG